MTTLLPALAASVAALLAACAAVAAAALTGTDRVGITWAYAAGAALVAVVGLVLYRRPQPAHFSHTLATGMLLVPAFLAVTHMALTGSPRPTTTVALAIAVGGSVLLSLRWLLALLYLTLSMWVVGAFLVGPSDQWPHHAVVLLASTGLALGVSHLRRQSARELADTKAAADAAAVRDHLTGVANRRGLAMVGAQLVENARRQGDAVHCLFVDVDGMARVNDVSGHASGDEVLVAVADALREVTRATDVVARWGGDEFCVVGPGPGMPPLELERRIHDTVKPHTPVDAEIWGCRVSAGGAMLAPWDAGSLETLLSHADQEMHLRRTLRKEAQPLPRRAAPTE